MVKFAWTWADYEREKAKAERKAARLASGSGPAIEEAKPEVAPSPPPPQELRYCKSCGKTVLNRCGYAGCPLQ